MQELRGVQLGPYLLERELGRIGGVRVFLGTQTTLGRRVIVKVLSLARVASPAVVERFQREAAAIARLRHPHIVTVHDFGEENGLLYLVTEYVEGSTLGERLGDPIPFIQVYLVLSQIASALDYAHSRGVIHRNIQPDSILLVERGGPRSLMDGNYHPWVLLSDFSLVKVADAPTLTADGQALGTPYYMSPEQAQGLPVDKTTDTYSLAIVAFEMLTGRVPFGGNSAVEVATKQIQELLPSVRLVVPDIPIELDRVLARGAAKDPHDRYQSAGEFADAFARAGGIEPTGRDESAFSGGFVGATPGFGPGEGPILDDEDEVPARTLPPWAIPIAGGVGGFIFICIAVLCGLNIVGPAVSRGLGLNPTPTATATATAKPAITSSPVVTGTVTSNNPAIATPTTIITGTVVFEEDREKVRGVVRQSNAVWAEAVGKGGDTSKLNTVFAGAWLNIITRQVLDLRASNQYREATLRDLHFDSINFTSATTASVKTTERWDDTLRGSTGALITTNPPVVKQIYYLERLDGTWKIVNSEVDRSGA